MRSSAVISKAEYEALLDRAIKLGSRRTYLALRCLGSLGLKPKEVVHLTVEQVLAGEVLVTYNERSTNRIEIPKVMQDEILKYCDSQGIDKGLVFRTSEGSMFLFQAMNNSIVRLAASVGIPSNRCRCGAVYAYFEQWRKEAERQSFLSHIEKEQEKFSWPESEPKEGNEQ